jgi:predicted nucleic acid-binding protein
MTLVDTGYLIAFIRVEDELHDRAIRWTKSARQSFLVTDYVLWEFMNGMSKVEDRKKAHLALDYVRTHPRYQIVPATQELTAAGLKLHSERPDKEWSLTDCISFHVMEQRGITEALAYDHHFIQAGFDALLRRDP